MASRGTAIRARLGVRLSPKPFFKDYSITEPINRELENRLKTLHSQGTARSALNEILASGTASGEIDRVIITQLGLPENLTYRIAQRTIQGNNAALLFGYAPPDTKIKSIHWVDLNEPPSLAIPSHGGRIGISASARQTGLFPDQVARQARANINGRQIELLFISHAQSHAGVRVTTPERAVNPEFSAEFRPVQASSRGYMIRRQLDTEMQDNPDFALNLLTLHGLQMPDDHPGFSHEELARLRAALSILSSDATHGHLDTWSFLNEACTIGAKKQFDAVLELIDLGVLDANEPGPDGYTMLHTIVHIADENPTREGFSSLIDKDKDKVRYTPIDARIEALHERGADMNASLHSIREKFQQEWANREPDYSDVEEGLENPEFNWHAASTEAEQRTMINRWLRINASPLQFALLYTGDALSRTPAIKALLAHGADADAMCHTLEIWQDKIPVLPIHAAAKSHSNEVLSAFRATGTDTRAVGIGGETLLHWAAMNTAHPDVAIGLLAGPAKEAINTRARTGETPLHFAAKVPRNLTIIKALLGAGAAEDIPAATNGFSMSSQEHVPEEVGMTPLHHAARYSNDGAVIEALLAAGAGAIVNAETGLRYTPLHYAAASNHPGVVKALLHAGAHASATGSDEETPLHFAAESNSAYIVPLLTQAGADVEARSSGGLTPLHYAAHSNSPEVAMALLNASADARARAYQDKTPLHFAAESNGAGVIPLLTQAGADVNARTDQGFTPLHLAVSRGNLPAAEALLAHGANLHARVDGNSALHLACKARSPELVATLLRHGADAMAIDAYRRTPLHQVCILTHDISMIPHAARLAELLLQSDAEVNAGDAYRNTALHYAMANRATSIVDLLLEQGANPAAANFEGVTPADQARKILDQGFALDPRVPDIANKVIAAAQKQASAP